MPIVLATFPVIEGVPGAEAFFNIVFFVVLTSTLVQGATFEPLARALGVTTDEPALLAAAASRSAPSAGWAPRCSSTRWRETDAIVGLLVNQLELPREALVSVIVREGEALLPRGSTEIEAGDRLHILVRQPVREQRGVAVRALAHGADRRARASRCRAASGRAPIFSVRPWSEEMGDPADPEAVEGMEVAANRCARAASSPARWCCWRTAASR